MSLDLLSSVRQLHDDYRASTTAARTERDRVVTEAERVFVQATTIASTALARGLSELLDATAAPDVAPPAPTEPKAAAPPEVAADSLRAELKAECMRLEVALHDLDPGAAKIVRQAKRDCGLDPERPTGASKCKAAVFGDYRAELIRLRDMMAKPAPAADPQPQPDRQEEIERLKANEAAREERAQPSQASQAWDQPGLF